MYRLLFLLSFIMFLQTSCTKEEIQTIKVNTLESNLQELTLIQEEMLSLLKPLHSLPVEEIQVLASSTTIIKDLKKYKQVNVEELEEKIYLFNKKMQEVNAKGLEEQALYSVVEANTKSVFLENKAAISPMAATPCYDSWENTVLVATTSYAVCVGAAGWSGLGLAGCSIGYGIAIIAADELYDSCISQYN